MSPAALAVLLCPASAMAFTASDAGTTGAQFLEVPVSARAVAMGDAQAASGSDASALYYNPARLLAVRGVSAVFTHSAYLQGIVHDYGALAANPRGRQALGVSVQHMGYGELDQVDNRGVATGESLSPRDLAVTAAAARSFGRVGAGAAIKYVSSELSSSARTVAADLGVSADLARLSLSLSAGNLGSGLRFRERASPLPAFIRLGSALKAGDLGLALDLSVPRGARPAAGAGAEYSLPAAGASRLALRAGFNTRQAFNRLGGLAGGAFGVGVGLGRVQADYALADFGALGWTHRVTLGLSLGDAQVLRPSR